MGGDERSESQWFSFFFLPAGFRHIARKRLEIVFLRNWFDLCNTATGQILASDARSGLPLTIVRVAHAYTRLEQRGLEGISGKKGRNTSQTFRLVASASTMIPFHGRVGWWICIVPNLPHTHPGQRDRGAPYEPTLWKMYGCCVLACHNLPRFPIAAGIHWPVLL